MARPIDPGLVKSVAEHYGKDSMGILLTGMGNDGALGLQAIHNAGGTTVAQDESSSVVFGMPKQAIQLGVAGHVLSLAEIPTHILDMFPSLRTVTR